MVPTCGKLDKAFTFLIWSCALPVSLIHNELSDLNYLVQKANLDETEFNALELVSVL